MTSKSVYLVLDMENDLIHADGPNGKQGMGVQVAERSIVANTRAALAKARAAGIHVGYVRVGFSPDYQEAPVPEKSWSRFVRHRKAGILKLGTWGTEVHAELAPEPGDFDIVKHRVSPFYATKLEAILRGHDATRIYCSGVSTNAVVQSCVREGHDRDYEMVLIEDCCSAASAEEHEAAVAGLASFCTVTTSGEVVFE